MDITWFGHAAFRLSDARGAVITDPYTPEGVGYAPITQSADLVVISSDDDDAHCRADLIPGDPAVCNALNVALDHGGAQNVAGREIRAVAAAEWEHHPRGVPGQNGMYRFEMDGMQIAHMGDVGNPLTADQIAFFEDVDVLLALAGGYLTIELPDLMTMIRAVRPKLVIPMHFRTLTYRPCNTMWIESFLSHFDEAQVDFAFGAHAQIFKEDLSPDTRVLVMDYVRPNA
ncbi:MBL fold metallo-hydrolase [Dinoroseobacter sp. S124A]|uniref:MBL fold metallo-hydrolase n=1 Tax=Dinoroseobacter sp. S124A TaxID=3415128 RepID=UPI003C7D3C4A